MNDNESAYIYTMNGGKFHLFIGEGELDQAERIAAVYDLIDNDQPIWGSWTDHMGGSQAHTTVFRAGGRHGIMAVTA